MKRLHPLLFVALLALSVWAVLYRRAPRSAEVAPFKAVALSERTLEVIALPGAALFATLDLRALGGSSWGGAALEQLLPFAGQREDCTRAVLAVVEQLALTIPAEGSTSDAPEFGVVALGENLKAAQVLDCAARVLRAHGGEPEPSRLGEFYTLRDAQRHGQLAVRDGGPLVLSGGSTFNALLERSRGVLAPSDGARERLHVALRRELGPAPLRLTWVLPPGWLERWLEDAAVSRSPLSELRALALRGSLAEQLSLKALLAADNDAGAQRIEAFLRATEADVRPIADAMLGSGQSPRVHIERAGLRVQLTTAFDARALVSRWLDPSPR